MEKILCSLCKNYIGDLKCLAYPKGIPSEILTGKDVHKKVREGQKNDIVFEELKK